MWTLLRLVSPQYSIPPETNVVCVSKSTETLMRGLSKYLPHVSTLGYGVCDGAREDDGPLTTAEVIPPEETP